MKRVDRYILKELMMPMIVGTIIIALLFMANEFISVFKNFEITRLPPTAIVQMVFYRMPVWLSMTLPAGTAIGVALAVSRLARESEITAMRSSGLPIRRILVPILLVGLLVSFANFYIVEKVIPPASKEYRNILNQSSVLASAPAFKSNVMLKLGRYTAEFGSIQRTKDNTILLKDILIIERPKSGEVWLYVAEDGTYIDGVWTIEKPLIWAMDRTDLKVFETPDKVVINERIRISDLYSSLVAEEVPLDELRDAIQRGRASGSDTTVLEIAYHVKYSLPASCLIFAISAAAVAVSMSRSGPFVGLIVSMALVMLFFNLHIVSTEIVGKNGWLPPIAAAWLPNVIYAVVAVVLVWRSE